MDTNKLTVVDRERHWNAIRIQIINDTHSEQGLAHAIRLISEFYSKYKSMPDTPPMRSSLMSYYDKQKEVVSRTTPIT